MSINTYLEELASELVLSESEKSSIKTSIDTLFKRLDSYFSEITEKTIFGSYSRGTILPRKADNNSDIDILLVFKNPNKYKPQTFLNWLKTFAELYYHRSEIRQSSPTIVLELNHIKFELTPAYMMYGSYYIPDGPSDWMYTNPIKLNANLTECNKYNSYKIKPIIRLIKLWNIQNNYRDLKSYKIEEKLSEKMRYSYISCNSYTDYLKYAFDLLRYDTTPSYVNSAIATINKAIEYERDNMPYTALSEIKKIFPEV